MHMWIEQAEELGALITHHSIQATISPIPESEAGLDDDTFSHFEITVMYQQHTLTCPIFIPQNKIRPAFLVSPRHLFEHIIIELTILLEADNAQDQLSGTHMLKDLETLFGKELFFQLARLTCWWKDELEQL